MGEKFLKLPKIKPLLNSLIYGKLDHSGEIKSPLYIPSMDNLIVPLQHYISTSGCFEHFGMLIDLLPINHIFTQHFYVLLGTFQNHFVTHNKSHSYITFLDVALNISKSTRNS